MKIFGIVMIFLTIFTAIGIAVYLFIDSNKKVVDENGAPNKKNKNENKDTAIKNKRLKELIGISEIKNGLIKMNDGGLRAVLSVSTPDFELLTDTEQETFENTLMQFALSIGFKIQFFTTTVKIETKEPAEVITKVIENDSEAISENLKNYAIKLKKKLNDIENTRGIYVRKSFCVIGVNIIDEKRAMSELKNRVDTVVTGLTRARMRVALLDSVRTAQLLADLLNKNSNVQLQKILDNGVLELYSEGLGVITNVNE